MRAVALEDGVEALADRLHALVRDLRLEDERGLVFPQQGCPSWTDALGVRAVARRPRAGRAGAGAATEWVDPAPTVGAGGGR